MPLSPEWAKLPKRKCDDCGKTYKPVRPRREGERGFCSDNCRKSYHKHGGAYRKLRAELEKLLTRYLANRLQFEEPCELCNGKGYLPQGSTGSKTPSQKCPKCINGAILTSLGRETLDFVQRRLKAEMRTMVELEFQKVHGELQELRRLGMLMPR